MSFSDLIPARALDAHLVPCEECGVTLVDPGFVGADRRSVCDECRDVLDESREVSHIGERGGTVHSLDEAKALHSLHRPLDAHAVRKAALAHALQHGSVHADDLAHLAVGERSVIGTAFAMLVRGQLVEEVGRRKSQMAAAHGRKSGVYRLTAEGRRAAEANALRHAADAA